MVAAPREPVARRRRRPVRLRAAVALGNATSALARRTGRGGGSVIGARVTLSLDPKALEQLAVGHRVGIVTGTNGKSTTTAMLAAACRAGGHQVASNEEGANLRSGIVGLLSTRRAAAADLAVLEIDELALPAMLTSFDQPVVVLLNLSRDQLDRFGEVRSVAAGWRRVLDAQPAVVVANADDPLVVYGAEVAADVAFVGVGLHWLDDSASCPACGGRIQRSAADWWCERCPLRRPPCVELVGDELRDGDVVVATVRPGVPGRHNVGNAAMAVVAAMRLGVPAATAASAIATVTSVAGRYRTVDLDGTEARLLLAKNPSGWNELLELIDGTDTPLLLAINARIADGKDPSWLWDVPYERLAGRSVIAAGDRALDLAVRLRYGGVDCEVWQGSLADRLRRHDAPAVDVLANYTAFADLVREVQRDR